MSTVILAGVDSRRLGRGQAWLQYAAHPFAERCLQEGKAHVFSVSEGEAVVFHRCNTPADLVTDH